MVVLDGQSYITFVEYQKRMQEDGKPYGMNSRSIDVVFVDSANTDLHLAPVSIGDAGLGGLPLDYIDTIFASINQDLIVFTPGNWSTPQEVTVTGIDNNIIDLWGSIYLIDHNISVITGTSISSDPVYDGIDPDDLTLVVEETTSSTVSIAPGADATESASNGHFVVSIDNGITAENDTEITAWFLTGSATQGTNYSIQQVGFTIPAGTSSSDVFVVPIDDPDDEGVETVVMKILTLNHPVVVMSINPLANEASINILDDDGPIPAGLVVTVTNNAPSLENGELITYVIEVNNVGTVDVATATVSSAMPLGGLATIGWTCTATSGASCAAAGVDNISDTVSLNAGTTVTYMLTTTVSANPGENVQLELTVTADGEPPEIASDIDLVDFWFKDGFE